MTDPTRVIDAMRAHSLSPTTLDAGPCAPVCAVCPTDPPVSAPMAAEATRDRIRAHTAPCTGVHLVITPRSGEVLKAATITGDTAVVVYEKHYGAQHERGVRTIVLRDDGPAYALVTEFFAPAPVTHVDTAAYLFSTKPRVTRPAYVPPVLTTTASTRDASVRSTTVREHELVARVLESSSTIEWNVVRWLVTL